MSSNIFVTFGSLAGTEQLQTRTRTGYLYNQLQTRTRTVTPVSLPSVTEERTRSVTASTSFTRFFRTLNVVTTCSWEVQDEGFGTCVSTYPACSAGAEKYEYFETGDYCVRYIGVMTSSCPDTNFSSTSSGFLCSDIYGDGVCSSKLIQYCTSSTVCTPGTWSSWTQTGSCTQTDATGQCSGQNLLTKECRTYDPSYCQPGTYTSWTNVSSCNAETGTGLCSGTSTKQCQTVQLCAWNDWTSWADVDVCESLTPVCSSGALQRQCQVV